MNDQQLIHGARGGDEAAIHALYRRHAPRVYAVVRRLAGDEAEAEDWAQETWIRVFRALPGFRGDAAFTTWLHRVAVNCALQGRRRSKRHAAREEPLDGAPADPLRPDRPVLRISLQRALDALPERMREVLVLHDVEGFTHEEIGELLGVAAGTSKSQLFKARAKMRDMLRPLREVSGEEVCHI